MANSENYKNLHDRPQPPVTQKLIRAKSDPAGSIFTAKIDPIFAATAYDKSDPGINSYFIWQCPSVTMCAWGPILPLQFISVGSTVVGKKRCVSIRN